MQDNPDLEKLWQGQTAPRPELDGLISAYRRMKRKNRIKSFLLNLLLVLTALCHVWIWAYFDPRMLTTKVGITLILSAMLAYLINYNRSIPPWTKTDERSEPGEFRRILLEMKRTQKKLQTRLLQFYFIAMGIGLLLALYEYARMMPGPYGVLTYLLTLAWIAFNWYYIRPRRIKRQNQDLDRIIQKINEFDRDHKNRN